MKSTEKTILTMVVGMAIGVGFGILFAPSRGADTRKKVRKEFDRCFEQLEGLTDEFSHLIAEGKEKVVEALAKTKSENENESENTGEVV